MQSVDSQLLRLPGFQSEVDKSSFDRPNARYFLGKGASNYDNHSLSLVGTSVRAAEDFPIANFPFEMIEYLFACVSSGINAYIGFFAIPLIFYIRKLPLRVSALNVAVFNSDRLRRFVVPSVFSSFLLIFSSFILVRSTLYAF